MPGLYLIILSSENQFCYSNASCHPGLYCADNRCKNITVALVEQILEEEVLECPICSKPTEWSECINNKQSRTNYRCNEETNYVCESYIEKRYCEIEREEAKLTWTDIIYEYWYVPSIMVINNFIFNHLPFFYLLKSIF